MKAVITVENFLAACGAVSLAASEDAGRPHIRGVRVELEAGLVRFVATDGHMCAIWEGTRHADSTGEGALTLPIETVRGMLAEAKKIRKSVRDRAYVWITADAAVVGVETIPFVAADDRFPPWRQIVPQDGRKGGASTVGFTAALLERASKIFRQAGSIFFAMNVGGELDPILCSDRKGLRVVVMPARV